MSTSLSEMARPTEPETALPPEVEIASARAAAPASPLTSLLSIAWMTAFPPPEVTLAWFTIEDEIACRTVFSVPTPAPAKAPVAWPLPVLPAADPDPPTAIARVVASEVAASVTPEYPLTIDPSIEVDVARRTSTPTRLSTSEMPAATATVAPPLPFDRPSAKATVPATPVTSTESVAVSVTAPFELVTCRVPPHPVIELVIVPSRWFTAAEPAPAIAPVEPVPRATDAATPTPRAEMLPSCLASRSMSPFASAVDPAIDASIVLSTSLSAMPTPIDSAPVELCGRREAAYARARPKASARSRSASSIASSAIAPSRETTLLAAEMMAFVVETTTFEA